MRSLAARAPATPLPRTAPAFSPLSGASTEVGTERGFNTAGVEPDGAEDAWFAGLEDAAPPAQRTSCKDKGVSFGSPFDVADERPHAPSALTPHAMSAGHEGAAVSPAHPPMTAAAMAAVPADTKPAAARPAGAPLAGAQQPAVECAKGLVLEQQRRAAQKLLDFVGEAALFNAGKGPSRAGRGGDANDATIFKRIIAQGGKAAGLTTGLLHGLQDVGAWMKAAEVEDAESLFPIYARDVENASLWLVQGGHPSRAASLRNAMEHGEMLGLEISVDRTLATERKPRRKRPGADAPNVLTPALLRDMEWATLTSRPLEGSDDPSPHDLYTRNLYVIIVGADRAGESWFSRYVAPDESEAPGVNYFKVVVSEDKEGRADVCHYVPFGGFFRPVLDWQSEHSAYMSTIKVHDPEYIYKHGDSHYPSKGLGWGRKGSSKPGARVLPCALADATCKAKATSLAATTDVLACATGMTEKDIKDAGLAGRSPYRHVAPYIAYLLKWPEPEACRVGDWTPERDDDGGAAHAKKASKKRKGDVPAGKPEWYADKASPAEQLQARRRLLAATRAAAEIFGGAAKINKDTTWRDLFPAVPPAGLGGYYGTVARADALDGVKVTEAPKEPAPAPAPELEAPEAPEAAEPAAAARA